MKLYFIGNAVIIAKLIINFFWKLKNVNQILEYKVSRNVTNCRLSYERMLPSWCGMYSYTNLGIIVTHHVEIMTHRWLISNGISSFPPTPDAGGRWKKIEQDIQWKHGCRFTGVLSEIRTQQLVESSTREISFQLPARQRFDRWTRGFEFYFFENRSEKWQR